MLRAVVVSLVLALALAASATAAKPAPVIVAVVDSGVTPVKGIAGHLVPGADLVDGDANASDWFGHGTEIASIVLSTCHGCRIMPVRVLGGSGFGNSATVAQGVRYAVAHGARVINLSLAVPSDNADLDAALEDAVHAGVSVVAAAGNDGLPDGYPAETAPDTIAVGSIDSTGHRYGWSNYGPWVDVWGPGVLHATSQFGKPVTATGTSGTAAYVSGMAAALIASGAATTPTSVLSALQSSLPVTYTP